MLFRKLMFGLGTCLLLCSWVTITVKGQATKTVKVDCTKGKSINKALNANKFVFRLIIEIHGICYENVDISDRKRVTLIGDDRDEDGIHGVSTDLDGPNRGNTIQISRTAGVRLEKLTISGGERNGIEYSYSNANTVEDCIVEGNTRHGLFIGRKSIVRVIHSDISGGMRNIGIAVVSSSRATLTEYTVIRGELRSLNALDHSTIIMTGGELDGPVNISRKSILHLFGVKQTDATGSNFIDDNSQLRTDCDDPRSCSILTSLFNMSLGNFSNASFANSDLDDLTCSSGADAVCDAASTPANAAGTGCPLCP